nr:hypothetical protein B0A51_09430 [Rachicladosporium sp. CCFEE 5018]
MTPSTSSSTRPLLAGARSKLTAKWQAATRIEVDTDWQGQTAKAEWGAPVKEIRARWRMADAEEVEQLRQRHMFWAHVVIVGAAISVLGLIVCLLVVPREALNGSC